MKVFRSEEGRNKILQYYNNILNMVPVKKNYIDTTYGKTFYIEAGKEELPSIVLIHGSCSNCAAWLGEFANFTKQYHVIAIDILGEPGNSDPNRLKIDDGEYSKWLLEVISILNLSEIHLIGNSLGGWLALEFAKDNSTRLKSLTLVAASGIIEPKKEFIEKSTRSVSEENADELTKEVLGNSEMPKEVLEFMTLIMENFIPITEKLPILNDNDLDKIDVPVLYIAGTKDITMNTTDAAERLKEHIANVETHIDDSAHTITSISDIVIPFIDNYK